MKKLTLLILFLACVKPLMAQYTVTLKPGDSMTEFTTRYVYRNPTFVQSKVIFNDGRSTTARLNYNQLSDRMEFIGPKGDTLEIVDNNQIKEVVLDKSIFRFKDGFFELLKESPVIKLAVKTPVRLIGQKKIGAMGIASQTTNIDAYQSVQGISRTVKLTPNAEQVFSIAPILYFGDAKSNFFPATQRNLQKILPEKAKLVAAYLKENQVSFEKAEDVLALLKSIGAL